VDEKTFHNKKGRIAKIVECPAEITNRNEI